MKKFSVYGEIAIFRICFMIVIMFVMAVLSLLKINPHLIFAFGILMFSIALASHTLIQRIKKKQIEEYAIEKEHDEKVAKDKMKYFEDFLVFQDIISGLFLIGSLCVLFFLYLPSIDFAIGIYKVLGIFLVYSNAFHYLIQIIFKRRLFGDAKKNINFLLSCIFGAIIGIVFIVLG